VSESTTENITDIDSAVSSIIMPEETIEENVDESQITDDIDASADTDIDTDIDLEDDNTEEEVEIEASDTEDDDDLIEDASPSEPSTHTVKMDGQDMEVTLEDLKRDYGGQKYVQKGMQDAAAQKKEAEAVYTALNNEREQIAQLYNQIQQNGMQAPPVKPSKEEFDADPIGYMQKNIEFEEASAAYNNQMAQLQQVAQKSSAAQENAHKAYLHEQMQILQKEIPAFADATKAGKLRERLVTTGTNHYGYTDNEISNITDARAIKVLLDAQRYQDIISGKSKAKVKTKSAKPVMKPGAKRTATPTAKIRERQQAKLKGSGSIEDALNLILNTT
jgi:hypothetical protein